LALGFCGLHPWDFERYTGKQLLMKVQGMLMLHHKESNQHWHVVRVLMAHISNWSGKSTRKGVHIKPEDILRLPGDKKKERIKLDIKKLWKKHQEHERRSGNN
jgi:hypothetical protein